MKKFNLNVAAFICAAFLITGCNKDDNSSGSTVISAINATVENGNEFNSKIDDVKALIDADIEYSSETGHYDWIGHEIASEDYTKGGFSLDLPKTVDSKYLTRFFPDGIPDGISISDTTVRGNAIEIIAYKSGLEVGYFEYISYDSTTYTYAAYIYVNKNVKISGSYSDTDIYEKYDVSLKKGWNIVYDKETESDNHYSDIVSSKAPSEMKWIYTDFNESYNYRVRSYNPATTKSSNTRKPLSFFK
jgi:hypothetical protein